jgi:hypothetical protein
LRCRQPLGVVNPLLEQLCVSASQLLGATFERAQRRASLNLGALSLLQRSARGAQLCGTDGLCALGCLQRTALLGQARLGGGQAGGDGGALAVDLFAAQLKLAPAALELLVAP